VVLVGAVVVVELVEVVDDETPSDITETELEN
jgi:hypothetical protein